MYTLKANEAFGLLSRANILRKRMNLSIISMTIEI